jgi:hypothetical protein
MENLAQCIIRASFSQASVLAIGEARYTFLCQHSIRGATLDFFINAVTGVEIYEI